MLVSDYGLYTKEFISLSYAAIYPFFSLPSFFFFFLSEDEAKLGARRLARCLQKLGFKVRIITAAGFAWKYTVNLLFV